MMEETSHPNLDVGDPLVGKCGSIKSFNIFKSSTRCTITTTCSNTTIKKSVAFQTTSTNHFFLLAIFLFVKSKRITRKKHEELSAKTAFWNKMPSERRWIFFAWKIRRMEAEAMISREKVHLPKIPKSFLIPFRSPFFVDCIHCIPNFCMVQSITFFFEIIHF